MLKKTCAYGYLHDNGAMKIMASPIHLTSISSLNISFLSVLTDHSKIYFTISGICMHLPPDVVSFLKLLPSIRKSTG